MKKKEKKGKGRKGSFLSSFHSTLQKGWEGNSPSRTFNEILLVVLHLAVSTKYIGSIYRPIVSIPLYNILKMSKLKMIEVESTLVLPTLGVGKWM